MQRLIFSESSNFYKELDNWVEHGSVTIAFPGERPSKSSPLWKRLAKCKGWDEIQAELENVRAGRKSSLSSLISPSFAMALTGGELFLAGFIVTLIVGFLTYAVYKGRNVKVVVKRKKPNGEEEEAVIEINDPNDKPTDNSAQTG